MKSPPSIARVFFPADTPLDNLLETHQKIINSWINLDAGYQPVPALSEEDIFAFQQRMQKKKNEHRQKVGWISDEEIRNIAGKRLNLAGESLLHELNKLRPIPTFTQKDDNEIGEKPCRED